MAAKRDRIYTSRDAARANASRDHLRFAIWEALHEAATAELNRVMGVLRANPDIGLLTRDGKPVYYVNHPEYREAADPADLVEEKPRG